MTNPLIDKYFELYPEKKEEPKKVEYELPEDFKTKLKELRDTSTIPSVALPNAPNLNTKANPYISALTCYDNESLTDSFLQIAEKLKNKQAQVTSMNMEIDHQTRTQRITFEVWLDSF
jgi:hypothetical protein